MPARSGPWQGSPPHRRPEHERLAPPPSPASTRSNASMTATVGSRSTMSAVQALASTHTTASPPAAAGQQPRPWAGAAARGRRDECDHRRAGEVRRQPRRPLTDPEQRDSSPSCTSSGGPACGSGPRRRRSAPRGRRARASRAPPGRSAPRRARKSDVGGSDEEQDSGQHAGDRRLATRRHGDPLEPAPHDDLMALTRG